MTACPHCGRPLTAPTGHRGELERQLGDSEKAAYLIRRAKMCDRDHGNAVRLADTEFVAWKGYVWARVRIRKPAVCEVTGTWIDAGAFAWRQLSEVRDRNLRVSVAAWAAL